MALVNTVVRAQDLYRSYPEGELLRQDGIVIGKRLPDGTEIYLFHARFPADWRQRRENSALATFGKGGPRKGRKILISTQVGHGGALGPAGHLVPAVIQDPGIGDAQITIVPPLISLGIDTELFSTKLFCPDVDATWTTTLISGDPEHGIPNNYMHYNNGNLDTLPSVLGH